MPSPALEPTSRQLKHRVSVKKWKENNKELVKLRKREHYQRNKDWINSNRRAKRNGSYTGLVIPFTELEDEFTPTGEVVESNLS